MANRGKTEEQDLHVWAVKVMRGVAKALREERRPALRRDRPQPLQRVA